MTNAILAGAVAACGAIALPEERTQKCLRSFYSRFYTPSQVKCMHVGPIEFSESSPQRGSDAVGTEQLINLANLEHRIGRNADLLRDLISLFLSTQPKDIKALRQAINAGELARSRKLAHRMAGAFASMAMDILARRTLEIEQHAIAGSVDACKADMAELEVRFDVVKRELAGALGRMMSEPSATTAPPVK